MNCHKCNSDLSRPKSVSRLYVSKKPEEYEDSHCLGHYDASGNFEPDGKPSYPVVFHDLLDNSDECQNCGTVVG